MTKSISKTPKRNSPTTIYARGTCRVSWVKNCLLYEYIALGHSVNWIYQGVSMVLYHGGYYENPSAIRAPSSFNVNIHIYTLQLDIYYNKVKQRTCHISFFSSSFPLSFFFSPVLPLPLFSTTSIQQKTYIYTSMYKHETNESGSFDSQSGLFTGLLTDYRRLISHRLIRFDKSKYLTSWK